MSGLTARQRAVVDFVGDFCAQHGYGPTVREIGEGVGLASTSSVGHQVDVLKTLGLLVGDGRPRTLRVARPQRGAGVTACPSCGQRLNHSELTAAQLAAS